MQINTIHLDFLANFPQNQEANALLSSAPYANIDTFNQAVIKELEQDSRAFARHFNKDKTQSFDYTSGTFLMLFETLRTLDYPIALASSLHQQSFYAGCALDSQISWIHPSKERGILPTFGEHSIESALNNGAKAFFLPLINQDLLTLNPVENLTNQILTHSPDSLIFLDISLFVSLAYFYDLSSLPTHPQILFLCNGESLGLIRPSGFLLSFENLPPCHEALLQQFSLTLLTRPNLFKAGLCALQALLAQNPVDFKDTKALLFDTLKAKLGENLSLFAPIEFIVPNALPLRFRHIKVRPLIQSLSIEQIAIINGQDCLFGNAKPSFVLQAMGYEELSARELVSLSYHSLKDIESIANSLARAYTHLQQIQL